MIAWYVQSSNVNCQIKLPYICGLLRYLTPISILQSYEDRKWLFNLFIQACFVTSSYGEASLASCNSADTSVLQDVNPSVILAVGNQTSGYFLNFQMKIHKIVSTLLPFTA